MPQDEILPLVGRMQSYRFERVTIEHIALAWTNRQKRSSLREALSLRHVLSEKFLRQLGMPCEHYRCLNSVPIGDTVLVVETRWFRHFTRRHYCSVICQRQSRLEMRSIKLADRQERGF